MTNLMSGSVFERGCFQVMPAYNSQTEQDRNVNVGGDIWWMASLINAYIPMQLRPLILTPDLDEKKLEAWLSDNSMMKRQLNEFRLW